MATESKDVKSDMHISPAPGAGDASPQRDSASLKAAEMESHEVFKKTEDGVDFRTVSWPRACVIFLKVIFASGVLSMPTALFSLGAAPGALMIIGWSILNTYGGVIQGDFKMRHPHCHSLADMAGVIGGPIFQEVVGAVFFIAFIICSGTAAVGLGTAFNALSDHATCTAVFVFVASALITIAASLRTLQNIGWLTWAGFLSIFVAVFIVTVGVTTRDRPAAAPQTGDFDLGYAAIAYPGFIDAMVATCTIFVSTAGTSAFIPVISEMRNPREYKKALYVCMGLVLAMYLVFSLVMYRWTGKWVANPSLGSAGGLIKKVAYGVGLLGFLATGCIYQHVSAKYMFVRILRNTRHLQANTVTHWAVWLSCSIGVGIAGYIVAEAIPVFNFLVALVGSACMAPLALVIPGMLWLYDFWHYKNGTLAQKSAFAFHVFFFLLGIFICIGGT
jgi:hypothetical protein